MHLSDRAIETPRLVILAALLICVLGAVAVLNLPKERTPRVKLPVIVVAIPNLGASPQTNEAQIIRKIEEEAGSLTGLRDEGAILSQAVHGAAIVQFVFDDGVEVVEAKRDVESLINRIKGEFPRDAQTDPGPLVNDIAFEDFPVIQVFVAGGRDGRQRRRIAEELQTRIEQVSGVAGVDIFGGVEPEVTIDVNPHRMVLYGFAYSDVATAIIDANTEAPTGELRGGDGHEARVRSRTRLESLDAIRSLPLGQREGKPILLRDVADVEMGAKDPTSLARYGGEDAAVLLVRAKTDIDVLAAADRIQAMVDQFVDAGGGEDTHIGTVRSQAREIRYMLTQLGSSAAYGTILVIVMLWLALGWRNAGLISVAVPFAILATAALMWVVKRTIAPDIAINNMTLFAMILVVGMVVDGCIVAGENIFRHRELGRSPLEASKLGIREVGPSLICAYLTTFAAFGPMFLVRGVMGDFLELLPITVIFALCAAMLVDHFLLPVLSMYLMKVPPARLAAARAAAAERRNMSPEQIEIENAEAVVAASPLRQQYGRALRYALHHRLLVLTLAVTVALTPAALFWAGAIGFEFFPEGDIPVVEVYFELPLGASMEDRTAKVAAEVEQAVLRGVRADEWYRPSPDAERVRPVTTMGEPGALNTNLDSEAGTGPEFGMVYVELELAEDRERTAAEIRQSIVDEMPLLPGVDVRVKSPQEGPPGGAPVLVRVRARGETPLGVLADRAAQIEALLRQIPGVFDVTNDHRVRPEVSVQPQRAAASVFGVDAAQVARSVHYALEGVRLGDVDFGGDEEIDLRLRNTLDQRNELEDLRNLPLRTPAGRVVSLDQVAQVNRSEGTNVIRHYDQDRVVNVRADLEPGMIPDDVKAKLIEALRPELTPAQRHRLLTDRDTRVIAADPQVTIEFGGENQIRDDALADLNAALLIAAAAMMIILTVKFNSFIQPLIVLFSVPLSLVGVAIGLMVCGFYFSISAMIGVVALSGIVVNDAIVLVDFINRLKATGISTEQAVVYAGQLRLRPVFLTTVTTIGGLVPLALNLSGGGEFWQPLTISIMCGLGFATLLQLFIIPLAYYTFDRSDRPGYLDPQRHPALSRSAADATLPTPA